MSNLHHHSKTTSVKKGKSHKNISKEKLDAQKEKDRIAKKKKKYNDKLNEALEQTFPASDSITKY